MNIGYLAGLVLLFPAFASAGVERSSTDPREIMKAVGDRNLGDRLVSRMTMLVTPASGQKVTRTMRNWRMESEGSTKRLLILESPANLRGTGLLVFDYHDSSKADDQWLYLPSLRRNTRISGGDKSGSFMGSDFSYSDMARHHVDHYDYKLLKASTRVSGEECWVIEAVPRTSRAKEETGYLRSHLWVSKDKLMVLQAKAWVKAGKRTKLMRFTDIVNIGGVWIARRLAARTQRATAMESTTYIRLTDVKLNDRSISDALFTQRRLEQGL